MFDFEDDASRREKCYTTVAQLPSFIDPKQPPAKRSPFTAIWGHPFVHTVIEPFLSFLLSFVSVAGGYIAYTLTYVRL
jgi:ribonuclease P/MRP protein subunit RPP40